MSEIKPEQQPEVPESSVQLILELLPKLNNKQLARVVEGIADHFYKKAERAKEGSQNE